MHTNAVSYPPSATFCWVAEKVQARSRNVGDIAPIAREIYSPPWSLIAEMYT